MKICEGTGGEGGFNVLKNWYLVEVQWMFSVVSACLPLQKSQASFYLKQRQLSVINTF